MILVLLQLSPEFAGTLSGQGRQNDIVKGVSWKMKVEAAQDLWLLNYVPITAKIPRNENVYVGFGIHSHMSWRVMLWFKVRTWASECDMVHAKSVCLKFRNLNRVWIRDDCTSRWLVLLTFLLIPVQIVLMKQYRSSSLCLLHVKPKRFITCVCELKVPASASCCSEGCCVLCT